MIVAMVALILLTSGASCQKEPTDPGPISRKRTNTPETTVSNDLLTTLPSGMEEPLVRVLLRSIKTEEGLEIIPEGDGWFGGPENQATRMQIKGGEVFKHENEMPRFKQGGLYINAPSPDAVIRINGKRYHGTMVLRYKDGGEGYELINRVGMEHYCAGSVGWEAVPGWESAALEAQAVAIRSYTLHSMLATRSAADSRGWDVDDTTRYLRYGGIGPDANGDDRETPRVREAVETTRGMVLSFQRQLLKTFFHATSGGHTNASGTAFGGGTIPPLAGTDMGEYAAGSSMHRWQRTKTVAEVIAAIKAPEAGLTTIDSIKIVNPNHGWGTRVAISAPGYEDTMLASDFRSRLGVGRDGLPSTNFTATISDGVVTFDGRGFGHGVGLDQWAAQGMAKAGMTSAEILRAMYPGAEIADLW